MLGQRGRGARGQVFKRDRGRGYMEGIRESRERSRSLCRGASESHVEVGGRGFVDYRQNARGRGHNGGRGRGVLEGRWRSRDERMHEGAEPNVDEMFKGISEVMNGRLESVVGNSRLEVQAEMRAGMRVLVNEVEELMGRYLDKVKKVEETIVENVKQIRIERMDMEKRNEEKLVEFEENVQKVRAEVGRESNERRNMDLRTKEKLSDVEDKVQEVKAEVGIESNERRSIELQTQDRLAEVEDNVHDVKVEVAKVISGRRNMEIRMQERLVEVENKVQEVRAEMDKLTFLRNKIREGESVREMEAKVRVAMCKVKVGNMDIGLETDSKATIVREVLGQIRKRTNMEEICHVNRILRRTRVVVLSKRTEKRQSRGRTENNVPVLFECQERKDAWELERILREAGYSPTFHWPSEVMEFIQKIRETVRKMENTEETSFIRIRPEVREGRIHVRADTKPKVGGKFAMKGIWMCPPLDRALWDGVEGQYTPRVVGRGG